MSGTIGAKRLGLWSQAGFTFTNPNPDILALKGPFMRCGPPTVCGGFPTSSYPHEDILVQKQSLLNTHTFPHWDLGFHILSLPLRPPFSFYQRDTACHRLISSFICLLSSYRAPDLACHPTWHRSASSPPNSCPLHKAPLQALRRGEWGRALMERCKEWTDTGTRVVHAARGQVKGWISTLSPSLFPERN